MYALLAAVGAAWAFAGADPGAYALKKPVTARPIVILTIEGIIDPVLVRYVQRAYREAQEMNAQCVVLTINTPGGLETSMREIVQETLNAPLPTIAYVTPKGARAASAGAFIVLACHLTSMAPGTTMGAAHPVSGQGKEIPKTLDKKITNDAAAFIRSLAQQRGRDVKWAEEAVTKSLSINEQEALKKKLIDTVAEDLESLLTQLDGRTVTVGSVKHTLAFSGAPRHLLDLSMRERFFHILAHPEIAYILLSLGTLGLIFELQTSGLGLAGVVGGFCLILALISLSILPFSVGGLLMMALGVGLFIADLKLATHGGLSLLGLVCLLFGSLMLFSPLEPFWHLSRPVIYSTVGTMGCFFGTMVWLGLRAQSKPPVGDVSTLIGTQGKVIKPLDPQGIVHVGGEEWTARLVSGARKIPKGEYVIVKSAQGLTLEVEPLDTGDAPMSAPPQIKRRS